ncbi:hypothetical protein BXY75_0498 [Ulvibacter antarcticus]|uniref:Uncharacterized protein n=1 Tax=Ulvibacter antarcticus TaxID=442714 RepID=A0A3L9Z1S9_9FLAO|nr:hypothetical protein BXY75_0498 [Ulvibacter antarcticus]
MEFFEYLTGKGGFMILALIVVVLFLYNKYKHWRYLKSSSKRKK